MRGMRVSVFATACALLMAVAGGVATATAQGGVPGPPADAGEAIVIGDNSHGEATVPPLPPGTGYTAAAAGASHTVLLRSDGQAIAFGDNTYGQTDVPPLPPGMSYTAVAARSYHTVLLRSDGQVYVLGSDSGGVGLLDVPALPAGVVYTGVATGAWHSVLLRSDGQAVAFGMDFGGRTDIPVLPTGLVYTAVAAGYNNTVLLRSDGEVLILGVDVWGSTDVPALPAGLEYTAISMGYDHPVLLRSDGNVIAFGYNWQHQADVPPLPAGVSYTEVAAGYFHTALVRSDGEAVAFGDSEFGKTDVPPPPTGTRYTAVAAGQNHTVLIRAAIEPHLVSFDTGPGGSSVPSATVEHGDLAPEPSAPTRVGYTFVEWRTGSADGPAWDFDTGTVTADLTLYAGWALSSYTIVFLVDGAFYSGYPIAYGEQLLASGLPPEPEKPGYDFAGWWHGSTEFVVPHTATGNLTLEAHWQARTPSAGIPVMGRDGTLPVSGVEHLALVATAAAASFVLGASLLLARHRRSARR